jgi:hypothetical protein
VRQWWTDWRNPSVRYRDIGNLADLENLWAQKRLALVALSGPCDPALELASDVPLEAAFPAWRWRAGSAAAADPIRRRDPVREDPDVPITGALELHELLASASLNGRYGLFGNAERAGKGQQATDPHRSYLAFILARFHDEFGQRRLLERGMSSNREVPQVSSLVTLYDDFCVVNPTEVGGAPIEIDEAGSLLLDLFVQHLLQEFAKYDVKGEPIDFQSLWRRLSPMAQRLTEDFRASLPFELREEGVPGTLFAFARQVYEGEI